MCYTLASMYFIHVSIKNLCPTVISLISDHQYSAVCQSGTEKANLVLGQLAISVTYSEKVTFMRLYQVFVLPHLINCAPAWPPYTKADVELLEKVQKRAVMLAYMETLEDRRLEGDAIEI